MLDYKKDRVQKSGKSPRDLQKRYTTYGNVDVTLLNGLVEKVATLTTELRILELNNKSVAEGNKKYTEEEVNDKVIKALEKELSTNTEVVKLKEKLKSLEVLLVSKEELIVALSKSSSTYNSVTTTTYDKPVIEETVVDPTDNKVKIKSYIKIKEEIKENMNDKVDKLKNILGDF